MILHEKIRIEVEKLSHQEGCNTHLQQEKKPLPAISSPPVGLSCFCLLLLLRRLQQLAMQQPCSRAFGSPDGQAAARTTLHVALADGSRSARRVARRVLRVSAAGRRGAAAYGVAFRCFWKARTHGCLVKNRWIIGFEGAILHNFLSTSLYHRG